MKGPQKRENIKTSNRFQQQILIKGTKKRKLIQKPVLQLINNICSDSEYERKNTFTRNKKYGSAEIPMSTRQIKTDQKLKPQKL